MTVNSSLHNPITSLSGKEIQPGLMLADNHQVAWQTDRDHPVEYDEEYFIKYVRYKGSPIARCLNTARVKLAKRFANTLLDVGIGCGEFIECLPRFATIDGKSTGAKLTDTVPQPARRGDLIPDDWKQIAAAGYDVCPMGIEWLKERGLWYDPFASNNNWFDCWTFWDSLEHMAEPQDILQRVNNKAYVLISMPIFDDLTRLTESKHYRPNEHFYYFTRDGLVAFMEDCDFAFVEYNQMEVKCGREAIGTFVFRKFYE